MVYKEFHYEMVIYEVEWSTQQIHKEWLANNAGNENEDWSYTWYAGGHFRVSMRREEDMLAFRLRFDLRCEISKSDK